MLENTIIRFLIKNKGNFEEEIRMYSNNKNPIMLKLINSKVRRIIGIDVDDAIIEKFICVA